MSQCLSWRLGLLDFDSLAHQLGHSFKNLGVLGGDYQFHQDIAYCFPWFWILTNCLQMKSALFQTPTTTSDNTHIFTYTVQCGSLPQPTWNISLNHSKPLKDEIHVYTYTQSHFGYPKLCLTRAKQVPYPLPEDIVYFLILILLPSCTVSCWIQGIISN